MFIALSRVLESQLQKECWSGPFDRSRVPQRDCYLFCDLTFITLDCTFSTLSLVVGPNIVIRYQPCIVPGQVCGIAKKLISQPEKLDVTEAWLKKDLHTMINGDGVKRKGSKAVDDFCEEFAKNPKFDKKITKVDLVTKDLH